MLGFITRSRLIRQDIRPGRPIFLLYDLFGLVLLWNAWDSWQSLSQFRLHEPLVSVSLSEVAGIGGIGLYGMRIAMFIALIRGLRMPQTLEWLVAIVPATLFLICLLFSSPIERAYIAAHDYCLCRTVEERHGSVLLFASDPAACRAGKAIPG